MSSTWACTSLSSPSPVPNALTTATCPRSHGSSSVAATSVSAPCSSRRRSSSQRRYTTSTGPAGPVRSAPARSHTRPSRCSRSASVTSAAPTQRAISACSHHPEASGPSVRTTIDGSAGRSPPGRGAASRSRLRSAAKSGSPSSSTPSCGLGSTPSTARRAAAAYASPDGVRRLSSSTSSVPSASRTTSSPAIAAGAVPARPASAQLGLVALGAVDDLGGDDPGGDDPPFAVRVDEEGVQGAHALLEPGGERAPLGGGQDPGDRVDLEGHRVGAGAERHARRCQALVDGRAQRLEVAALQRVEQRGVVRAGAPVRLEGLVVGGGHRRDAGDVAHQGVMPAGRSPQTAAARSPARRPRR